MKPWLGPLGAVLLVSLLLGGFVRPLGPTLHVEVGTFDHPLFTGPWSGTQRARLDPQAVADEHTDFHFRSASAQSAIHLPVVMKGEGLLAFRGKSLVRGDLSVHSGNTPVGRVFVTPDPWTRYEVPLAESAVGGAPLDLTLALRPRAVVRNEAPQLEFLVDALDLSSARGLVLAPRACATLAAVPVAVFALACLFGHRGWTGAGVAGLAAVAAALAFRAEPMRTLLAVPRLVPVALLGGLVAHVLLRRAQASPRERAGLAWLVAAGIAFHGAIVFFPDHLPPGIRPHVNRSLDFGDLPFEYGALLKYGSHFASATQGAGDASEALGKDVMIPYSPFPYVFYYLLSRTGLDLYWALTVANGVLAMGVVPVMWLAARAIWNTEAAWLAVGLYTLDLAVWHHVARAHGPAAVGGALATSALLAFAWQAERLGDLRWAAFMGLFLGLAVITYSSLPVHVGLFGLGLLALLVVDASGLSREMKQGAFAALVCGGVLAAVLYYAHYVPGLLKSGAKVEAAPEVFEGRTFLIFHNESKENLRLWLNGYWAVLLCGLLAAPVGLWRARASAQPFLLAWLGVWVAVMILKEPFLFPRFLRWAKEDQFVSPLFCLLVAAAVSAIPGHRLRQATAALVLAGALALEVHDFVFHTNTLFF